MFAQASFPTNMKAQYTGPELAQEIYNNYNNDLKRFAAKLHNGDWQKAKDLVQDAYVSIVSHPNQWNSSKMDSLKVFAICKLRNTFINSYRSQKAQCRQDKFGFGKMMSSKVNKNDAEEMLLIADIEAAIADHEVIILRALSCGYDIKELGKQKLIEVPDKRGTGGKVSSVTSLHRAKCAMATKVAKLLC